MNKNQGLAAALVLVSILLGAILHGLVRPQAAHAAPIDPPAKVAGFLNATATADTGIVTDGFVVTEGSQVEAVVICAQISATPSEIYLTCTDGMGTTERILLNGNDPTPELDVGEAYTFTHAIIDRDQRDRALTWNVEFEETTTMDLVTIHRAQVP